jgi:hypothetical protein
MDWKTVEERILQDDQNKWDRNVAAKGMRLSPSGALELSNGDGEAARFAISDLAVGQLCQRLEIPVAYYRRLPGEMKAVVANHDLERLDGHAYLQRGKGEWIRAFLSADYVPYNNTQIAETTHALLKEANVSVKLFVMEETHLFVKIISEEIIDSGSGLKAGVMVGNSEVGLGSISVEPFVFRLACTNDLVVTQEKNFKHAHIHFTAHELNRRMADALSNAFRVASSTMDAFLKTREEPVSNPAETIRKIATERNLPQKFADQVVSRYQAEPEPNRFGVINAFTSAAQLLAPLQRIEVERFAGTLLTARF